MTRTPDFESAMPNNGIFVTGTDTGVGKTAVSLGIMTLAKEKGLRVAGWKPVASGCRPTPAGLRSDDAVALQAACSTPTDYATVNPVALQPAVAPQLAARESGQTIDIAKLAEEFARHRAQADLIVVEGIGGWLVPLGDESTVADLAKRLSLPVLLVVGLRLGCLNHALLTGRAIQASGQKMLGWVGNWMGGELERQPEVIAALEHRMDAPLLGVIPRLQSLAAEPDSVAGYLAASWPRLSQESG